MRCLPRTPSAKSLDHRAHDWSRPSSAPAVSSVKIDPTCIRCVGKASRIIDAKFDGVSADLSKIRLVYKDADSLHLLQKTTAKLGPSRFSQRTGLGPSMAQRASAGKPISKRSVAKATLALREKDPVIRLCALEGCNHQVYRPNALYCSCKTHGSHRASAEKRRQRAAQAVTSHGTTMRHEESVVS